MDDMQTFERRVATEVVQGMGPSEPVDDAAIFTAITTTRSPKWRFQSMFSATKFVVAGAIVALFGGFLLSGVLTQPSAESVPAAATSTPGTFSPAGALRDPRWLHTATLLPDGRILVVGGHRDIDVWDPVATAEIWDPATESSAPAGWLAEPREGHTATLLPDGRVLIVGGGEVGLESAEVWDPDTERFAPAGTTTHRHGYGHTATLLPDGRVLIVGSFHWNSVTSPDKAEIWDPTTMTFEPADMPDQGRGGHTATLLPEGRVLFVGGDDNVSGVGPQEAPTQTWDAVSGSLEPAGTLAEGRVYHTATLLPDGRVVVLGGGGLDGAYGPNIPAAEIWDPVTASFSTAGSLAQARKAHTATLLPDGRVLVVGGNDEVLTNSWWLGNLETGLDSVEAWDPGTGAFEPAASLAEGRFGHTATLLPDGRVLVLGGLSGGSTLASAEVWSP